MNYDKKVSNALAHLESVGFNSRGCAPIPHRFLWRRGYRIAPPHFASFGTNLMWVSICSLIVFGPFSLLVELLRGEAWTLSHGVAVLVVGLGAGVLEASTYKRESRLTELPSWRGFDNNAAASNRPLQTVGPAGRR